MERVVGPLTQYFARPAGGQPPPLAPVTAAAPAVRDYAALAARIKAAARPPLSWRVYGQQATADTTERYDLLLVRVPASVRDAATRPPGAPGAAGPPGVPPARRHVLLNGGTHGEEPAGAEALVRFLEARRYERWPGVAFTVVPCANPWGYAHARREGPGGRDLNRAFRRAGRPPPRWPGSSAPSAAARSPRRGLPRGRGRPGRVRLRAPRPGSGGRGGRRGPRAGAPRPAGRRRAPAGRGGRKARARAGPGAAARLARLAAPLLPRPAPPAGHRQPSAGVTRRPLPAPPAGPGPGPELPWAVVETPTSLPARPARGDAPRRDRRRHRRCPWGRRPAAAGRRPSCPARRRPPREAGRLPAVSRPPPGARRAPPATPAASPT